MPAAQHTEGWLSIDLKEGAEDWAKQFREERDKRYGNIFSEEETDRRWTGDLGERVFDRWLRHHRVQGYQWIQEGAAGAPDFILPDGTRVGVKTVKRKVPPALGFTAQITARHADEPTTQFFFLSYEFRIRRMWLLGGIYKPTFLEQAIYYPPGSQVHRNYTIREGHEIYNIGIDKLTTPMLWLQKVLGVNR